MELKRETIVSDSEQAWLAERQKSLGASNVGTALGLNLPFATPLQLYAQYTGELDWPDETEAMAIGRAMQPAILGHYARRRPERNPEPADPWTIHRVGGWLHATPDGYDGDGVVEVKLVGERRGQQVLEGEPYLSHVAQLYLQMLCTGRRHGTLVYLISNRTLRWFDYQDDPETTEPLLQAARDFWLRVEEHRPPAAMSPDAKVLARLYPRHEPGSVIALPDELHESSLRYAALTATIADAERERDQIKAQVEAGMQTAELATLPDGSRWTWKAQDRKEYTVKAQMTRPLRYWPAKEVKWPTPQ